MCDCNSYNMGDGSGVPEVILNPPDVGLADGKASVCVDACIAGAISHLWSLGLATLNCCCGHSTDNPSVVIPEGADPQSYLTALRSFDGRDWRIYRWELAGYM